MSWRSEIRTSRERGARWWMGAAGVVAAAALAAYWLDPERGAGRRERAAARAAGLVHGLRAGIERRVRYVTLSAAGRLRGRSAARHPEAEGEAWPEEAPPDVDSEAPAAASPGS